MWTQVSRFWPPQLAVQHTKTIRSRARVYVRRYFLPRPPLATSQHPLWPCPTLKEKLRRSDLKKPQRINSVFRAWMVRIPFVRVRINANALAKAVAVPVTSCCMMLSGFSQQAAKRNLLMHRNQKSTHENFNNSCRQCVYSRNKQQIRTYIDHWCQRSSAGPRSWSWAIVTEVRKSTFFWGTACSHSSISSGLAKHFHLRGTPFKLTINGNNTQQTISTEAVQITVTPICENTCSPIELLPYVKKPPRWVWQHW